jgi:carbon monoxide dehydrogenase subunit G
VRTPVFYAHAVPRGMKVREEIDIQAPPQAVWAVVSDIPDAAATVQAIERVEVLEPPKGPSLVGLKWRETRTMFGKQSTEVMWVTQAVDGSHYVTRAESHGAVYQSRIELAPRSGGTRLSMSFEGTPATLGAKVAWALMGPLMKGATRKAIRKDLEDIRRTVEAKATVLT